MSGHTSGTDKGITLVCWIVGFVLCLVVPYGAYRWSQGPSAEIMQAPVLLQPIDPWQIEVAPVFHEGPSWDHDEPTPRVSRSITCTNKGGIIYYQIESIDSIKWSDYDFIVYRNDGLKDIIRDHCIMREYITTKEE